MTRIKLIWQKTGFRMLIDFWLIFSSFVIDKIIGWQFIYVLNNFLLAKLLVCTGLSPVQFSFCFHTGHNFSCIIAICSFCAFFFVKLLLIRDTSTEEHLHGTYLKLRHMRLSVRNHHSASWHLNVPFLVKFRIN